MAETASERRVCLLTGASGRLGNDFCRRYGDVYDIAAVCRRRHPDVASQRQIHFDPVSSQVIDEPSVFAIDADLTAPGAIERVVELTLGRFGQIDVLINAAVFVERERLTTLADNTAFLDRAFHVNTTIPIQLAATIAREFWFDSQDGNRARNRNVINISSGAGLGVTHAPGLSAYSASKVALNFLTCFLADELTGVGVRVNALAPTTFPDLIPTEVVSDAVYEMAEAEYTGEIVELSEEPVGVGAAADEAG